jgi:peptide deformylase
LQAIGLVESVENGRSPRYFRVDRRAAISYVRQMTIRPIITIPDPVLREVCAPVATVDDDVRKLADDMLETMYDAPGIGLAASQIGLLQRIFVLDVAKDDAPKEPMVFINPKIVWSSDDLSVYQEGCLSIPDYYEEVERPAEVTVQFLNREGAEQELKADGLLATCIQHELDHLNGKLFIDYLSKLKRDRVVKKFTKQAKLAGKL